MTVREFLEAFPDANLYLNIWEGRYVEDDAYASYHAAVKGDALILDGGMNDVEPDGDEYGDLAQELSEAADEAIKRVSLDAEFEEGTGGGQWFTDDHEIEHGGKLYRFCLTGWED